MNSDIRLLCLRIFDELFTRSHYFRTLGKFLKNEARNDMTTMSFNRYGVYRYSKRLTDTLNHVQIERFCESC